MFGAAARSRLLPMSLPFRYFGAAIAFHALAWSLLLVGARDALAFEGGLGPVFAALHLITLGVLAMTAAGATLQLLPVATRQPVRALGAVKLVWWLLVPGTALFAAGGAAYAPRLMASGAAMVLFGLAVYAYLLGRNLVAARGMRVIVAHGWVALACLLALAGAGVALVARYEHGLAVDYAAVRGAHLVLAAYGFMGALAFGLSNFLLPMLAVAPPPPARRAYLALAIGVGAVALALSGFALAAAILGLASATLHIASLERSLGRTLRAPLGPAFVLIRVSWGCLLGSLLVAALIALDLAPPRASLLFGLLLVPGWLLTFLLGVLQRIVPFLASVHASSAPGGTPLISALTPAPLLATHRVLHPVALAALLWSILAGNAPLAQAGAAAGLLGAIAYGAFFAFVLFKARNHGTQPPHQPAPA